MRKTLRLGLLAVAAATALAFVPSALGAYDPSLTVTRHVNLATGATVTDITFAQTDADDATALVAIFAPVGFTANIAVAPGTQIGTLEGSVIAGAFGGATVPVAGTIVAGDPANQALQQVAQQCTGGPSPSIWLLNVTAAGQSLPNPVPVFLALVTTPPGNAFFSARIQLCLPPPPAAAFQIKLLNATLHISGVFAPPAAPGDYRWTAFNVPYSGTTPNPAAFVQTQSIDQTPVNATLTARRQTKTRRVKKKKFTDIFYTYSARLSGQVTAGGQPAAGVQVEIFAGSARSARTGAVQGDPVATATTNSSGSYSATVRLTKTTTYHAVATREPGDLVGAACVPPPAKAFAPVRCGKIRNGGFEATTDDRTVVKPKLNKKRIKNKKKKKKRPGR